jgi:hypothetical protein
MQSISRSSGSGRTALSQQSDRYFSGSRKKSPASGQKKPAKPPAKGKKPPKMGSGFPGGKAIKQKAVSKSSGVGKSNFSSQKSMDKQSLNAAYKKKKKSKGTSSSGSMSRKANLSYGKQTPLGKSSPGRAKATAAQKKRVTSAAKSKPRAIAGGIKKKLKKGIGKKRMAAAGAKMRTRKRAA